MIADEDFIRFPKMARMSRDVVVTEKIDGTNAQILVTEDGEVKAGSRNRWIKPGDDNFGFAFWVSENKEDLLNLGVGRHYGEWWGRGIQRGYGLDHKKFSLFRVDLWSDSRPKCCDVVPVLYCGTFDTAVIESVLDELRSKGSVAAPGYMKPEGVIVYHTQGNFGLKKTLEDDGVPKSTIK